MNKAILENPTKTFFKTLFDPFFKYQTGFIELRQINNESVPQAIFTSSITESIEMAKKLTGNIYFGVAPRSQKSGKKESIDFITCLWVDVDYGDSGHKKASPFATKEDALEFISQQRQKPSIIVHSGHGLHCYWLLNSLTPVTDFAQIENTIKGLIKKFRGDAGTHDISRILRVPGTFNNKDESNPLPVTIIHFDPELRYSLKDFREFENPQNSEISSQNGEIDINQLNLSEDVKKLILKGKTSSDPYPSRSEADFRVVTELIKKGFSDSIIHSIFNQYPIGKKHREQGQTYLKHTIENARKGILENLLNVPQQPSIGSFLEGGKINSVSTAKAILKTHEIIFSGQQFFIYKNGVYQPVQDEKIQKIILDLLETKLSKHKTNEILFFIQTEAYIPTDQLNKSSYLNLKNGLFNIESYEIIEHTPEELSSIQLNIEFDPEAKCPLWVKSLDEIFEGNKEKINLVQEFMGLCLTKETKYEKALFLLGDGANGKSVIISILSAILGHANYSAIPLEKFNNLHYVANLFGKQANISLETNVKSEVYDSTFKAVVSGDEIEADQKFKKPFTFKPFCKLIFALNNLPRVDDKTSAFFRRLLIVRFDRQFSEKEQDKNLKFKLIEELNGIFIWCLEGLKRLRERGHFHIGESIKAEIIEYQKENNNILIFVEDSCSLNPDYSISVNKLHTHYQTWCKDNGYKPLSKIKFGKQLQKCFPHEITKEQTAAEWRWEGIDFKWI